MPGPMPPEYTLVISPTPCPLSFRPSEASGEICQHARGNNIASKRRSAKQAHESARYVRCGAGCGAPKADFGPWRAESGFVWVSR